MDEFYLNLNEVEDAPSYEPVPAGEYLACVVEANIQDNKAQTGKYLKLKYEIKKGEFEGRFIWENLNFDNPSIVAQNIAKQAIKKLCAAIGIVGELTNLMKLIERPLIIKYAPNKKGELGIRDYKSLLTNEVKTTNPVSKTTNDEIPF